LVYGDLITQGSNNFRYCGIPDDILDLIFRDLYQEEIDDVRPNIALELTEKVATKDKKSLQGMLNELKGRMLELIVYRELNRCRKKRQPVKNFRQRLRPILNVQHSFHQEDLLSVSDLKPLCSFFVGWARSFSCPPSEANRWVRRILCPPYISY